MGKKLAIRGHSTRGKEVIKLLEMVGGDNRWKASGEIEKVYYSISNGVILYGPQIVKDTVIFTLEEFLDKYPFKIGDKVIDKADGCPGIVSEMKWDEGLSDMKYFVTFGNGVDFGWYLNDSIEFCEENKNLDETHQKRDIDKSDFIIKHMILPNKMDDKLEYEIIDGYEFDRVENNKIILKPIKPKYPKTYKECCDVLLISPYYNLRYHTYEPNYDEYATSNSLLSLQDKLNTLGKLIICYNAYRKIAGEELGLNKPWEPNEASINAQYGIRPLLFPSKEIYNIFYDNFKDLIEQCKELL